MLCGRRPASERQTKEVQPITMPRLCATTPSYALHDGEEMVPTEPIGALRGSAIRTSLAIVVSLVLATLVACSGGVRLAADSPVMFSSPRSMSFVGGAPSLGSPGYRAIVAASVAIGAGLPGVVVLQVLVATLAATRLLTVGRAMGGTVAGLAAVALFTLNPDQIRWHAYILPDSLYTSILILTVAAIVDAWSSPSPVRLLAAVACGFGAGLLSATGFLLVPIALAAWLVKWGTVQKIRWAGPLTVVATLACCLAMLPSVRESYHVATTRHGAFDRGVVVRDYQESWLPMPANSCLPGTPGKSGLAYAIDHPSETIHLAVLRVIAVLAHVRPYYTPRHNLALLVLLIPMYTLAVLGLIGSRRQPLAALLTTVIAAHLIVVAITCSDWDGRWLSLVLPLIGVLAARGVVMIRWPLWAFITLAIPALLVVFVHPAFLTLFAFQFRVNDPAPSDALVLLLGGDRDRPHKTAELYRNGMGSVVLVGADPDLRLNRDALIDKGVAAADILSLGPTIGTREEAWRVRSYVNKHPEIRKITIVTTAFHTARACWIFRRALRGTGVEIHAAASNDPRFDETDWFTTVDGVQAYSQEIFKLVYALLCDIRGCPLAESEPPGL